MKKNFENSVENTTGPLSADELELHQDRILDSLLDDESSVGRWQLIWSIILSIYQGVSTFHMFVFVFQSLEKDFWCNDSGEHNVTMNSCTMKTFGPDFQVEETKCTEFRFVGDGVTLNEQFALVCDRKSLGTIVETSFLAGAALGSVSSGWISDRYGRKHTLMAFATVQAVFGSIAAFSTSLAVFMTLRVIIGFASMTVAVVSFVLVVELVSGRVRTIVGICNVLPMSISYIITAGIAYFVRDWNKLQLVISMPWMALLLIWYCVPESPRWLLATRHMDELYAIIERAARYNKRTLPSDYRKILEAAAFREATMMEPSSVARPVEEPIGALGKSKQNVDPERGAADTAAPPLPIKKINPFIVAFNKVYLRRSLLNLVVWLTLVMIYFGLTLHMTQMGGEVYTATMIGGLAEAASVLLSIVVVLKIGKRLSLIIFMVIAGGACLLTNVVPKGRSELIPTLTLAWIAKCVIGANNAIIPIFTAAQYPTEVRNFGVGLGNLAAGIAFISVPFMWSLEEINHLLPITILGFAGIVGAVALYFMKSVKH